MNDEKYLKEMLELVVFKGYTVNFAASAVAEKYQLGGYDGVDHDDADPQRFARKYRERFGSTVIRIFEDPDGYTWYEAGNQGAEYALGLGTGENPSGPPAGWKKKSTIKTKDKRDPLVILTELMALLDTD